VRQYLLPTHHAFTESENKSTWRKHSHNLHVASAKRPAIHGKRKYQKHISYTNRAEAVRKEVATTIISQKITKI
jgi:hypothetical protein